MLLLKEGYDITKFLKFHGFDWLLWGGLCPFQIEANHMSGIYVYFRSRHTTASLEVYPYHHDAYNSLPDDDPIWEGEFTCWEEPYAGYLESDEAAYVFHSLWTDAKDYVLE